MQTNIQKWGNSQAVRLPKVLLETAHLGENDIVQIVAEPNKIIIRKANQKHKSLKERLSGFNGEYAFEEWETGQAVGHEILRNEEIKNDL